MCKCDWKAEGRQLISNPVEIFSRTRMPGFARSAGYAIVVISDRLLALSKKRRPGFDPASLPPALDPAIAAQPATHQISHGLPLSTMRGPESMTSATKREIGLIDRNVDDLAASLVGMPDVKFVNPT
jgi:hypothetical protein